MAVNSRDHLRRAALALCICGFAGLAACNGPEATTESMVERGRYLTILGGCNDCHTPGWPESLGKTPEAEWLTGSGIGQYGPWGTTYPANLRLRVQEMPEEDWVNLLHTRTTSPPMPWQNLNRLTEADARALYRFIKSLGPKGEHVPSPLPPSEVPTTPYVNNNPVSGLPPAPAQR